MMMTTEIQLSKWEFVDSIYFFTPELQSVSRLSSERGGPTSKLLLTMIDLELH
jgi:hypothetical protein